MMLPEHNECPDCHRTGFLTEPDVTPIEHVEFCRCHWGEARRLAHLRQMGECVLALITSPFVPS